MTLDDRIRSAVLELHEAGASLTTVVLPSRTTILRRRAVVGALAAIVAVIVLMVPGALKQLGVQQVESADQPSDSKGVEPVPEPHGPSDQPPGSLPRSGGGSAPGVSGGSSKDSRSGGSPSEEETSRRSETAGPPVFHTDQADDAYGQDAPPNAALSQPAFDILRVDWGPASYVSEGRRWGYSISIDLKGSARADGSYTSAGLFPSNDPRPEEGCQLFHSLVPGTTAFASAMCGSNETRREVGRLRGSAVTVTPTAGGGTRISATFDDRDVPPELEAADRRLQDLYTWTCMQRGGGTDCSYYVHVDILDVALSKVSYRI